MAAKRPGGVARGNAPPLRLVILGSGSASLRKAQRHSSPLAGGEKPVAAKRQADDPVDHRQASNGRELRSSGPCPSGGPEGADEGCWTKRDGEKMRSFSILSPTSHSSQHPSLACRPSPPQGGDRQLRPCRPLHATYPSMTKPRPAPLAPIRSPTDVGERCRAKRGGEGVPGAVPQTSVGECRNRNPSTPSNEINGFRDSYPDPAPILSPSQSTGGRIAPAKGGR